MAYVDSVVRNGEDESGQVIVLTGFLVAIAIVVVAVTLNSLIFAQDLSTRDDGLDDREILGFEENTERMATGLAHDIGHNSSGNITQDDLFSEVEDVEENYNDAIGSYAENATVHIQSRNGIAEVEADIEEEDTAWIVGQREVDEFKNESDASFPVLDFDDEDFEDVMNGFRMEVEVDNYTAASDEFAVIVSDDFLPETAQGVAGADWELSINSTSEELVINASNTEKTVTDFTSSNGNENFTIEMFPGEDKDKSSVFVDGEEEGDGEELVLELDEFEDGEFMSIAGGDAGVEGRYEIRLDGGEVDDGDGIIGPCDNAPCVDTSQRGLHAVAAVDDGSFTYSYTDADTEYTRTISGISAEQDGLPLEVVEE